MVMLCDTLLVPTSMSWTDLRPTLDFIREIDERKDEQTIIKPHVVVIPNRVSPHQRNFSPISEALADVNAIMAPPISDLSAAAERSEIGGAMIALTSASASDIGEKLRWCGDTLLGITTT